MEGSWTKAPRQRETEPGTCSTGPGDFFGEGAATAGRKRSPPAAVQQHETRRWGHRHTALAMLQVALQLMQHAQHIREGVVPQVSAQPIARTNVIDLQLWLHVPKERLPRLNTSVTVDEDLIKLVTEKLKVAQAQRSDERPLEAHVTSALAALEKAKQNKTNAELQVETAKTRAYALTQKHSENEDFDDAAI